MPLFQKTNLTQSAPVSIKIFTKMSSLLTRQAFPNQNGQCLVVDAADMDNQFLNNVIKAAENVLAIACSVRGGIRIPAFSLSVLTKGTKELFEFDTIRGNFNHILFALNGLPAYCQINVGFDPQDYRDSLYHAINTIMRSYSTRQGKVEWLNNVAQIEITFVTMRDAQILESYIQNIIQDVEVSKIFRIVIIELKHIEHEMVDNKTGLIHTIVMNGTDYIQIQKHFKSWLLDQTTDIGAILHLPGPESPVEIKCDISECVMNPLSLPFGYRVYLQIDSLSTYMTGMSVTKTALPEIPIYEINIVAKVSDDAICESSLFGMPFCLRPTKSWRLSVEDEEANQGYFSALCDQLSQNDQFLLAKIKSHLLSDQFCPYFVLIPGDCCMLMRSFATSDLTLPWKQVNSTKDISIEKSLPIMKNLQSLELLSNLDSNLYECGLLSALKANLKHAKRDSDFDDSDATSSKRYKRSK